MKGLTRRRWLAAAGATTAVAGTSSLFGQEATPANTHNYNFKDISPRELIQRRHLPNVELITQDNQKVHFYTDLVKDRRRGVPININPRHNGWPINIHK